MGVVYKGFDPDIERPVAIKMLHAHLIMNQDDDGLLARFRQEAQAAARCLHTNIVTVFDFGVIKNSPYMVMEYVDGIDLRSFLREGSVLTIKQIGDLVIQMLEALDYAHMKGVVHRDIKPANVLLLESGHVKVTDFGVAKLDTSELTNVGDVIGTPSYMSPEALRGDLVDGRSDLYSTGIVLMELIMGSRPQKVGTHWTREEIDQVVAKSSVLPPQLDIGFGELLAKVVAAEPKDRFATGQEFAAQLKALISPNQVYVPELNDLAATVVQSKITFSGKGGPATESRVSSRSGSQIALSPEVSQILSQTLAPYLGPVASHMIRNAASSSASLQEMIDRLSQHIPHDAERRAFINTLNQTGIRAMPQETTGSGLSRITTIGSKGGTTLPAGSLTLSGETVQKLTQLLAHHVGPLASRIVKKSVANASSLDELYVQLAKSIPEEEERTQFIVKARKSI